jgi:hypothetical protein
VALPSGDFTTAIASNHGLLAFRKRNSIARRPSPSAASKVTVCF